MEASHALPSTGARVWTLAGRLPAIGVLLFGLAVLYCAGFLNLPQAHGAAHDSRHAAGFPCH
ncbi:MAG: CbtB-domain containing protein [Acidobacteria bacterium]|nr:CbtB-domain containing protein [Acidobacteriota bacterium]MBI3470367.1 CbtB-domain containing protein [Candidatus Solibacter usitatus]